MHIQWTNKQATKQTNKQASKIKTTQKQKINQNKTKTNKKI